MSLLHDHTKENSIVVCTGSHISNLSCTSGKHGSGGLKASCCGICRRLFHSTPGVLALVTGLVQGVAGPEGVLGVIPVAKLSDPKFAALYLGSFCLTSAAVMGGFSAFYGTVCACLSGGGSSDRLFVVEIGSALLSICVGIICLVLLAMGIYHL